MVLLSFWGTLRLILILLVVWLVLRMLLRSRTKAQPPGGTHWAQNDGRPRGDVRIERPADGPGRPQGPVEDADFEEVK
jgi:hypothetical protein